jgi:hypothetical protein
VRLLAGLVCSVAVAGVAVGVVTACGGNNFVAGAADASSTSGSSSGAGGGPSFCAIEGGAATFCADFDESTSVATSGSDGWSAIDRTNDSTVGVVNDPAAPSQPSSLNSATPTTLGLSEQRGRVEKIFSTSASRIVVSFQVQIDAVADKPGAGVVGGTSFVEVVLGDVTLGLGANALEVSYFEDQASDAGTVAAPVGDILPTSTVKGTWVPVSLDIDIAHAQLTASVAGTTVGPVLITLPAGAGASSQVYIGVQSHNVDAPLQSHYDNVLINVTP